MQKREIAILRIGHRPERDQRVTTHVALTGRALGASGMYLAASDKGVVESVHDVAERWGGDFFCEDSVQWRVCIREWKESGGKVVHLTMYGINLPDIIEEIRPREKLLVVVGAEKVPGEMYGLADYNVAVTGQPHSEISSLALFLDHLQEGKEFGCEFPNAKIRIVPSRAGKQTEEL
ncbi:MAG: tRNA (cytidine(56)-2'-O)-methyltransferase [Methanoregula sp.]|nr:tRNA (cytidine(56)-2'-O)-methyltransferase [Methanoregula sp.]